MTGIAQQSPIDAARAAFARRAWRDAFDLYAQADRAGGLTAGGEGHLEQALAYAREAIAIGERAGDKDVQALALVQTGQVLVAIGQVREGMALVDEATMAAVSGDLGLMVTGRVYCCTISACRDVADIRRASDWTEAAHRWCDRQSVSGFPGVCRVHRAEIT